MFITFSEELSGIIYYDRGIHCYYKYLDVNPAGRNALRGSQLLSCNDGIINIPAEIKDKHIIVTVEDNGIGLPVYIDFENTSGFGMRLAGIFIKQIKGSITTERHNGTQFAIQFDS